MSITLLFRKIALAVPTAAVLLACGSDPAAPSGEVRVRLRIAGGPAPTNFNVVATSGDAQRWTLQCPTNAPGAGPGCTDEGFAVEGTLGTALTIKAPGHAFVDAVLSSEVIARGALTVTLTPLQPFVANEAYETGIEPGDEAAFRELAVSAPTELGQAHSVKFYMTGLRSTPKLYLQNTRRFPLHYDFVRQALGSSLTRAEFELRTYRGDDRDALAGTLTYLPELEFESRAYGGKLRQVVALQFFPSDDLPPDLVLRAHRLLEERLLWLAFAGANRRLVYVPAATAQERSLQATVARFWRTDALFSDNVEFYAGIQQQILNAGVAYGTLRLITPEALATTVVSFRDILVLPRLPNDLPLVGGTITEELQTPLAHVNLAARARGTPNIAVRGASTDPALTALFGKLCRFEVTARGFSLQEASLAAAEAHWSSSGREPLVPQSDVEFTGLPAFEELGFADAIRVGAKAANLAELRRLLGDEAPAGFAVPFSAFDAYMKENRVSAEGCAAARSDCGTEGRAASLCDSVRARCEAAAMGGESFDELVERLIFDAALAQDTLLREASVDALAYLVRHGEVAADFAAALDARVRESFGTAQVRLRSSTNAEDLPGFSGAGLYESVSARADGDKRASSRIRDVWASVFRFRAFEERQLWNVDHRAVRMAVAVNAAVDDEAVNGVLITQNLTTPGAAGLYVNVQHGEVEVTNPESGAVPEIFSIVPAPDGLVQVARQRFSSLSPDQPLLSDAEIVRLSRVAERIQAHFSALYQQPNAELALDLEFKLVGPERRLLVKQTRPYSTVAAP